MNQSNMWDYSEQMADRHANSGGIFVRLTGDGDKVIGAFCGDPLPREVIWNGERFEEHDKEVHGDKRPTLRVMVNFFVPAEDPKDDEMKVAEGNSAWFKALAKVRKKYGLGKWLFEIERHGEAGSPKTKYSILPEVQIDAAMQARIEAAQLHNLRAFGKPAGMGEPDEVKGVAEPDRPAAGPIDAETTAGLISRLKALPRGDVDEFLSEFKVQRVRDLQASQEGAAAQLVTALETRARQQVEGSKADVDPWA